MIDGLFGNLAQYSWLKRFVVCIQILDEVHELLTYLANLVGDGEVELRDLDLFETDLLVPGREDGIVISIKIDRYDEYCLSKTKHIVSKRRNWRKFKNHLNQFSIWKCFYRISNFLRKLL